MRLLAGFRKLSGKAGWLALFPFILHSIAHAQPQASEPDLKAAVIANMLLFVEWPARGLESKDLLTICYLEKSPVADSLALLDGKLVKGKTLHIVSVSPDTTNGCQALYFSPNNPAALQRIPAILRQSPVLLFGDAPGFLQRGVMINLEQVSGRLVFDIDLKSAQSAGLRISSKALRLARQVNE